MIAPAPKKSGTLFEVIDVRSYLQGNPFRETEFRRAMRAEDWTRFDNKRVLVRGCGRVPIPPWAFMLVLANLGNYPRLVAYGEECAPVVVFRRKDVSEAEEQQVVEDAAKVA